ncbi:hypothetical protein O181_045052 [Austropuccinia psidii MF-1]|uniref:Uncharacterized protein n=1 Tax=Austropuccinia psidii MF-1 TaxID=1389203 RepID=A0A9Q3DT19_9BASI|nr:hypothetical protein [Austropuccinia psidii MF-1]
MVHTRNGRRYSVKPDGPGQGRGKTRTRSAKSSSRKTHLEDARTAPHSPRSVPTKFDVNSDPELIEGNVLRVETLQSGSHRNISVPIQKFIQRSNRRGVGNMSKHLEGGHELLLTHQELSGSGEDHRTIRRVEAIVLQRQGQKDKELAKEPKSFICRPEVGIGNYPTLEQGPVVSTSSRSIQRESKRTKEEEERSKEQSGKGKRQSKLAQTIPTRVQDPQI